jgi:hypothetical protein
MNMEENYEAIDEAMVPMHEQIVAMLEITEGQLETDVEGFRMQLESVGVELPVQLDVIVNDDGEVVIGSSPPLYYLETGVLPVFHHIRFNAVAIENQTENES